jgi:hypothetical protein
VFQGYGRAGGYRPNYGIAGYGAAIGGTGIAGALLGFFGPPRRQIQVPVPVHALPHCPRLQAVSSPLGGNNAER